MDVERSRRDARRLGDAMKTVLAKGIHTQLYRDASGFTAGLPQWLRTAKEHGVSGILFHGFVNEFTPDRFSRLAETPRTMGFQVGAAFGLGDVGTNGARVGKRIGDMALVADYTVLDMEGAWEQADDRPKARDMCVALRSRAPDALLIDQPWARPIPGHHGSPLWMEMAEWTDLRAPQWYVNDLHNEVGNDGTVLGIDALERMLPDYTRDWTVTVPARTPKGIQADPFFPTWQAYHWGDLSVCVHALLLYPTSFMWCENHSCKTYNERTVGPYPTELTRRAMRIVAQLRAAGFDGVDAVDKYCRLHGMALPPKRARLDKKPSVVSQITPQLSMALGVQ